MRHVAPPCRSAAILIVEDEPLLRMVALDMVEEAGFSAYDAGNADEALALLETRDDIGLVFTDINMPGSMDGIALGRLVCERWPWIRLAITSAQPRSAREMPAGAIFLAKPYRLEPLIEKLHALIDERADA
jgi:two-component system, response regulator PdtaR